jgi:hypothetical protein
LQGQTRAVLNLRQAKVVASLYKSGISLFLSQLQPQHKAAIQGLLRMKIYCMIPTPVPSSVPIASINLLDNNKPQWSRQTPLQAICFTLSPQSSAKFWDSTYKTTHPT